MEHTEPGRSTAPKVPVPAIAPVRAFAKCVCGATITSGFSLCDQCSRRGQFTGLGDVDSPNQTAGTY